MNYSYLFKIIIIGDSSVGKSCLLTRFSDGQYNRNFHTTLGVDFGSKMISIGDKAIKLHIWDTAGQETFKSITKSYYRGAAGIILVYDITNKSSFDHLTTWINDIKTINSNNIPIIIVGNKSDLHINRKVELNELEKYASENGYLFKETSVKSNINVSEIFFNLAEHILDKIEKRVIEVKEVNGIKYGSQRINNNSINIRNKSQIISKCC